MLIRSFWLIVLLSSCTSLPVFCLVSLSIAERWLFMVLTIIVDLSIFWHIHI